MPLSPKSLTVWKAVAARGVGGIGSGQLIDQLSGVLDREPLRVALNSLLKSGYLRCNGQQGRYATWFATNRVPLGEEPPAWLDDVETETDLDLDKAQLADQAVAHAKAHAAPWPFGALHGSEPAAPPAEAARGSQAAAAPAPLKPEPWFAIDSENRLSLRADGLDGRLSAASTRALFCWLDRLAYQSLRETVEARP